MCQLKQFVQLFEKVYNAKHFTFNMFTRTFVLKQTLLISACTIKYSERF